MTRRAPNVLLPVSIWAASSSLAMQYLDDDGTNALEEVLCVVSSWMDIGGGRVALEQTVTPVSSTKLWKIQAAHVNVRRASAIHYRENVSSRAVFLECES